MSELELTDDDTLHRSIKLSLIGRIQRIAGPVFELCRLAGTIRRMEPSSIGTRTTVSLTIARGE